MRGCPLATWRKRSNICCFRGEPCCTSCVSLSTNSWFGLIRGMPRGWESDAYATAGPSTTPADGAAAYTGAAYATGAAKAPEPDRKIGAARTLVDRTTTGGGGPLVG